MSFPADTFLSASLQKREGQNALRSLSSREGLVDFCSNDYLGFAVSSTLRSAIEKEYLGLHDTRNGSGGSRLLAGNSAYAEMLEKELAAFHECEAALLYNSGYDANVGLFSSLGQKDTVILYDELVHASVHDGIRMSASSSYMFRHNDLFHLEERLKTASGVIFVAVESIYSMDGDEAPLKEIAGLCRKYGASLVVDEAHATGVLGKGQGLVQELGLVNNVFARVHTFGKALGCHGAVVVGSHLLRNYLINFSRSFIYTTALPLKSLVAIRQSYRLLNDSRPAIARLEGLIAGFRTEAARYPEIRLIGSHSPVQCILASGNAEAKALAACLQENGFDVRPILSPTVAKGKERLRICIHAFNTPIEIQKMLVLISKFFEKKMPGE